MQCRSCGNPLPIRAVYCPICGNKLLSNPSNPDTLDPSSPSSTMNPYPQHIPLAIPPSSIVVTNTSNARSAITVVSLSSQLKELLLLAFIFIVIVSSIGSGFFSIIQRNQAATTSMQATAQVYAGTVDTVSFPTTVANTSPLLTDSLRSNTNGRWRQNAGCVFKDNTYHVLVSHPNTPVACLSNKLSFDDVAIQVDVSFLSGTLTGLALRSNSQGSGHVAFYFFGLDTETLGVYFIRTSPNPQLGRIIMEKSGVAAVAAGDKKNRLLVSARGGDFKLYINGTFVGEEQDTTFRGGNIGFITESETNNGDGSFSNLKVFRV